MIIGKRINPIEIIKLIDKCETLEELEQIERHPKEEIYKVITIHDVVNFNNPFYVNTNHDCFPNFVLFVDSESKQYLYPISNIKEIQYQFIMCDEIMDAWDNKFHELKSLEPNKEELMF